MKSRKKNKTLCWLWMLAGNFLGATVGQNISEHSTKGSASCELHSRVPWGQTLQREVMLYKLGGACLWMQRHFWSSLFWSKMLFHGSRATRTGQRLSSTSRGKCRSTCRCSSKVTLFQLSPLLTPNSGDLFNPQLSVFCLTTLVRLYIL